MDSSSGSPEAAATAAAAGFGLVGFVFIIAFLVFTIYIYWRIASKAGYNGALSLLMLVPVANLIVLLIFAFGEWPIETKLKQLTGGGPFGGPPMGGPPMGGPPVGGPPATL